MGIKPMGNLFLSEDVKAELEFRRNSLGWFASLSEECMIDVLSFLDPPALGTLSQVSRYMCAFSEFEELWRDLFWNHVEQVTKSSQNTGPVAEYGATSHSAVTHSKPIEFASTWKQSLKKYSNDSQDFVKRSRVSIESDIFSDLLYTPNRVSHLSMSTGENIDRISHDAISVADFVAKYELPNKPMILTKYIEECWSEFSLDKNSPKIFSCGPVSMTLSEFQSYIDSEIWKRDESPLFVFDAWAFASLESRYSVPRIFGNDLFDLLEPPFRPDNAWLLIGPPNASSKWHVDPNSTNAWNGVVSGAKRWLMLPPHLGPPPGVETSGDGFAVRQPLHLSEWFESFYQETVRIHGPRGTNGLVECTCQAGEIVFVPRGWWHCVRNLETTVAITQNYAAESSLFQVRTFLKKFAHCVSGIDPPFRPDLWSEFDKQLKLKRPDLPCEPLTEEEEEEVSSFWENFGTQKTLSFSRN